MNITIKGVLKAVDKFYLSEIVPLSDTAYILRPAVRHGLKQLTKRYAKMITDKDGVIEDIDELISEYRQLFSEKGKVKLPVELDGKPVVLDISDFEKLVGYIKEFEEKDGFIDEQ